MDSPFTVQACVSQKSRKLFGPESVPKTLPKTVCWVSQSTQKVRAHKKYGHFTAKSYGSSHASENVFGKLGSDKMAAAGGVSKSVDELLQVLPLKLPGSKFLWYRSLCCTWF